VLLSFPVSFNGFAWNLSAVTQNQPWRKKFPGKEIQALDYFYRAPTMLPFGLYNCLVFPWALCLNTHYTETFSLIFYKKNVILIILTINNEWIKKKRNEYMVANKPRMNIKNYIKKTVVF
jgi:hypothetical protein